MTPVDSIIAVHDPENGQIGDCHRACIASLLDLPILDVPHFFDYPIDKGGDKGNKACEDWLNQIGLTCVEIPMKADSLDDFLDFVGKYTGKSYYFIVAKSKGGHNHCVIGHGNKIVHDPTYPGEHGIVGPTEGGWWWIGFLVKL